MFPPNNWFISIGGQHNRITCTENIISAKSDGWQYLSRRHRNAPFNLAGIEPDQGMINYCIANGIGNLEYPGI